MKKITSLLTILAFAGMAHAQQDVHFKINHKLGAQNFAMNTTATNDLGNSFQFTRIDYYVSQIRLYFDGGQDTLLSDTYVLVKGDQPTNELLGNFNFSALEKVEFSIGVDNAANHSDPSARPSGHPLSFQSPSMHWGWAAGYRFAALEGQTGASMNQTWQLHALGDKNYGFATVTTAGVQSGNDLIIDIDGDYTKAFAGVTVDANLNYHGEDLQAPSVLQNFQNLVFTEASGGIGIEELQNISMKLSPNPTSSKINLVLENAELKDAQVIVTDMLGRTVFEGGFSTQSKAEISFERKGMYLVSLKLEGQVVETQKVIVQ